MAKIIDFDKAKKRLRSSSNILFNNELYILPRIKYHLFIPKTSEIKWSKDLDDAYSYIIYKKDEDYEYES